MNLVVIAVLALIYLIINARMNAQKVLLKIMIGDAKVVRTIYKSVRSARVIIIA